MPNTTKLADVKQRFLAKSTDNRKAWSETEPKRAIGMALALYRAERGLSQKDVAEQAGWDKGFVLRLEGAQGGYPETATLQRYAEACGARLVVGLIDDESFQAGQVRVLDVMPGPFTNAGDTIATLPSDFERFKTADINGTSESKL